MVRSYNHPAAAEVAAVAAVANSYIKICTKTKEDDILPSSFYLYLEYSVKPDSAQVPYLYLSLL